MGNKSLQSVLAGSETIPAAVCRWNEQFDELNWKTMFTRCFKSTSDTQLRWFQSRLLHGLLPTNRYLFIRKIIDSPLCTFCGEEEETNRLLFWRCQISQRFWSELEQFLHVNLFQSLFSSSTTLRTEINNIRLPHGCCARFVQCVRGMTWVCSVSIWWWR